MSTLRLTSVCALLFSLGCASDDGTGKGALGAGGPAAGGTSSGGTGATSGGPAAGGTVPVITPPTPIEEDCDSTLPVVYRDFQADHPDFEEVFAGDVIRRGLVAPELGVDSKPVFASTTGCPGVESSPLDCDNWTVTEPEITSKETFDQWYRDVPDVNLRFEKELILEEETPGTGEYVYDSSAFFPLAPSEGFGATPPEHINQNFFFTTEIHLRFTYRARQRFTFRGDDDLWIFVNKKLALDLGGMHRAIEGTIDFDLQAQALGIQPGLTYAMDIFHAERHTTESNFRIQTNIACFAPGIIR